MTTHLERAQATLSELREKRTTWQRKRDELVQERDSAQRGAVAAAIGGTPTATLADQLSRHASEISFCDTALDALATQIADAEKHMKVANIADLRRKCVAELDAHQAWHAAIEPELASIERKTGLRFFHPQAYSEQNAWWLLSLSERAEDALEPSQLAAIRAQRETAPTDDDKRILVLQYPHLAEQVSK